MNSIFRDDLFKEKVALVTGGGSGIGLRTARELSQLGATVVLASRNETNLQQSVELIESEGGTAHGVVCNIREEESILACVEKAIELAGTIDFLVNNAGGQFPSPAEAIRKKGWHAVIETNLTGTFYMSQAVFNSVFKEKGGVIVNVIANIWNGMPMMAHTGAARAGVENLTKTLATEWGRCGVRINSVAPGVIHSSGLDSYSEDFQKVALAAGKYNQACRLGTEAEVAAAILFLLSPATAFMTGTTLHVDGGEPLYHPFFPPSEHDRNTPFE